MHKDLNDVILLVWNSRDLCHYQVSEDCRTGKKEMIFCHSDEDVFNDLTEKELREHLNNTALPSEKQNEIKEHVMNLLDEFF